MKAGGAADDVVPPNEKDGASGRLADNADVPAAPSDVSDVAPENPNEGAAAVGATTGAEERRRRQQSR